MGTSAACRAACSDGATQRSSSRGHFYSYLQQQVGLTPKVSSAISHVESGGQEHFLSGKNQEVSDHNCASTEQAVKSPPAREGAVVAQNENSNENHDGEAANPSQETDIYAYEDIFKTLN